MRAVAIDTSSRRAGVALWDSGTILAHEVNSDRSLHAESVIGLISRCFHAVGWAPSSVDLCVCGIGPGSFTGVRIGLATAKGLAVGLDRPIIGIGSLDAMAWAVPQAAYEGQNVGPTSPQNAAIFAMVDAGRGQVFGALYDIERHLRHGPVLLSAGQLRGFLESYRVPGKPGEVEGTPLLAIGEIADGPWAAELMSFGASAFRSPQTDLPDAGILAGLGVSRLSSLGPGDLDRLEPLYGRAPDITAPKS